MKSGFFAVAFAAASFSGAALADDVSGAWKVTGDVVGNAVETVCTFAGGNATCTAGGKAGAPAPAKVDGKNVSWDWDAGQAVLTFKGTLTDAKNMKGDIEVQGVTGDFTAVKQ
jgi:hypothetical protein